MKATGRRVATNADGVAQSLRVLLAVSLDGVAHVASDGTIIASNDGLALLCDRVDGDSFAGSSLSDLVIVSDP